MTSKIMVVAYLFVIDLTEDILFIWFSLNNIGPAGSQPGVLGIAGHQLIFEAKICIHAYEHHVKKSRAMSVKSGKKVEPSHLKLEGASSHLSGKLMPGYGHDGQRKASCPIPVAPTPAGS